MISSAQKGKIKRLMKRIEQAKRDGANNTVIKERTQDLYNYLEKEGLVERYEDE